MTEPTDDLRRSFVQKLYRMLPSAPRVPVDDFGELWGEVDCTEEYAVCEKLADIMLAERARAKKAEAELLATLQREAASIKRWDDKRDELEALLEKAEAERDAAIACMEKAENERDEFYRIGFIAGRNAAAEVAKHAYTRWAEQDPCQVVCDVTACDEIAAAIRALTPPEDKP